MKTPDELRNDINETMQEIGELIDIILEMPESREKKRLQRKLRELQYLQLWRMGLLRSMGGEVAGVIDNLSQRIITVVNEC